MLVTDLKVRFKSVDNDKPQQTMESPILLDLLEPSIQSLCKKKKKMKCMSFNIFILKINFTSK